MWTKGNFSIILFILSCIHYVNCSVEACKSMSSSLGCDVVQEIDWHADSNICKDKFIDGKDEENAMFKKCAPENLDFEKIRKYAEGIQVRNMLPLLCDDPEYTIEMGVGVILIKAGYPQAAVQHFDKLITGESVCAAMYYGRAMAYTKLGLSETNNAAHTLSDYTKALHAANAEDALQIYEARAQAFSTLGQHAHAYADYTEAIKILPTFRLYLLRGICLVFMERYSMAYSDLQESLRLQPQQTMALHYKAMCLFHLRRLEEAVKTYEAVLMIKPENTDIMQSLANAYKELGNFQSALEYYNKALIIQPTNPHLFQDKGELLYSYGNMEEAVEAFKNCFSLEPFNSACEFMAASSYASLGQFYPAIKELTKESCILEALTPTNLTANGKQATVNDRRAVKNKQGTVGYPNTMYLREWCRYIHSHLDTNVNEFSISDDISVEFKEKWSRGQPFTLQNYTEQPGLQPHIKDINPAEWEQQPDKIKRLLCHAYNMGKSMHLQGSYFGDDIIGNTRGFLVSGLASLQLSQTVQEFWKAPKSFRSKNGKKFTWKDACDIAVKWMRLVDVGSSLFWMDNTAELSRPYVHRIALIQSNGTKFRYIKYLPKVFKVLQQDVLSKSSTQYDENIEPIENFYHLYNLQEKEWDKDMLGYEPYIISISKLASKKDRTRKTLDGYTLLLQLDSQHRLMLMMDLQLTWSRTEQFHAELEYLWQKIAEDYKEFSSKSNTQTGSDSIINLIISLSYYLFNLFPLSRSSTTVTYSTAVGLILALGRETTGKIPHGKEIHMEALTTFDYEKFRSNIRSWISFKKASNTVSKFENVAEHFSTFRSILQVLHYDYNTLCKAA